MFRNDDPQRRCLSERNRKHILLKFMDQRSQPLIRVLLYINGFDVYELFDPVMGKLASVTA